MSTSNFGVSAFGSNTLIPTLTNGVITSSVSSGSVATAPLTLSSPYGIYFGGTLGVQDLPLAANAVLTVPQPFMCNVYMGGGVAALTIPPLYPGARILVTNNSGGNSVITASVVGGIQQVILVPGDPAAAFVTMADTASYMFMNNDGSWLALKFVIP